MSGESSRLALPVPRSDPTQVPEKYTQLRGEQPVCPVSLITGDPAYLVTRYEDLRAVLADRRLSRGAVCAEDAPQPKATRPNPDSIINMDPPRHARIRKLAAQAFTPARLEKLRPRMEEIVADVLDEMAELTPPVDLVAAFARPLPLRIVCELLGIPFEDQAKFVHWTDVIMTISSTTEEITQAYVEMRPYFVEIVDRKRKDPGDDFLSILTQQSDEQGVLTHSELVSLGTFLLVAGHETTSTVIANSALFLFRNPDQLAALRADPGLLPGAVEEMLRLSIPGVSPFPRIAVSDVTIGGVVIPQGSAVVVQYETALRDPDVYDHPDTFDIRRRQVSQVFFGHGPHFCLGAPVARAEMEIGMWRLFERFPTLALAVSPQDLKWKDYASLGGFEALPVTW